MKVESYILHLEETFELDRIFDEMYYNGGYSARWLEKQITNLAESEEIELEDLEEFDWDEVYNLYYDSQEDAS